MALVLTLRPEDDFYVENERFLLREILSESEVVIERQVDGKLFSLNERRSEEIYPSVRVSVGGRGQLFLARLAFNAPRDKRIMRGELLRQQRAEQ